MVEFLNEFDILKKRFSLKSDNDYQIDAHGKKFIQNLIRRNIYNDQKTKKIRDFLMLALENEIIPRSLLGYFYLSITIPTIIESKFRREFNQLLESDDSRFGAIVNFVSNNIQKLKLPGLFGDPINNLEEIENYVDTMVFFKNYNIDDIIRYLEEGETVEESRLSRLKTDDYLDIDFIRPDKPILIEGTSISSIETQEAHDKFIRTKDLNEQKRIIFELHGLSVEEPKPEPEPEQGFTTQMETDQNDLNQETDRARSNNFLKSNLLELNQNPVLKTEPLQYITQAQDLATAQRRRVEEYKYQMDEFDRAYEISQLMNEQQYLTQQIYSNMMYGIPSYQSNDITRSKEFFHK